jgi:membrane protein
MRYALNRALGLISTRPFVLEVLWSLVAVPVAGGLLALASFEPFVVSMIIKFYGYDGHILLAPVVSYIIAFLVVFGVTFVLYNKLPARKHSPRFGFSGALFCAISWAIVQFFFAVYTQHVNFFHIYGAVSAILVLLFWFYLMGLTFLYGAQLCVAYEIERGALPEFNERRRPITPR